MTLPPLTSFYTEALVLWIEHSEILEKLLMVEISSVLWKEWENLKVRVK